MRLIELRRHLLLALGIPATLGCGGSAPPEGGTRMYVAGAGSGTGAGNDAVTGDGTGPVGDGVVRNVVAAAPVGQCGGDQLRETVCGAVSADARSCGPMGDSLTSYGNSQLYVTQGQFSSHDATFAGFALDDDATARYRVEIHDFQASLPVEEYCCYTACTTLTVAASAPLDVPAGHHVESRCFPAPPGGTSQPAATNPACPAAVVLDGALRPHDGGTGASCCYQLIVADPPIQQVHHNRGRPARIDGVAHVAGIDRTTTWRVADAVVAAPRDATPTTGDLRISIDAVPAATRARLAGAWTEAARLEHASIASFANLALRLMAVGAPPDLLAATHRAALDEIEHARVCFALASAWADEPRGPAAFDAAARMDAAGGVPGLALESFVDGCVGETVAAAEAHLAADGARDPAVAAALRVIAEDETRHAALAWRIVAWCLAQDPTLRPRLDAALATARADAASVTTPRAEDDLRAHGVVDDATLAALRRDVLTTVVAPCLAALGAARPAA